jgi:methionyl aminopeptidase
VVCHGIPNDRVLKSGDLLNIDVAIIKDGYHGDTSRMYYVGNPPIQAQRLTETCRAAMWRAIERVRPGAHLGDLGHAIQEHAEASGYSVVREYCGHGIGRVYHEDPQVLHYGEAGSGMELVPGMVFTIEPMINAGKRYTRVLPDGWTVVTKDHSLSAQWEHMVLVTPDGHEVLTLSAAERHASGAACSLTPPHTIAACSGRAPDTGGGRRLRARRTASLLGCRPHGADAGVPDGRRAQSGRPVCLLSMGHRPGGRQQRAHD